MKRCLPISTESRTRSVPADERTNDPEGLIMSTTEETHHYEIELELSKHDFREDLSQIRQRLHETRARLSPTHTIGEKSLSISVLGLLVGFVLGYRNLPFGDIGKPLARTMLTTVGKQIAVRAIGG
jgi:hypothetical protein